MLTIINKTHADRNTFEELLKRNINPEMIKLFCFKSDTSYDSPTRCVYSYLQLDFKYPLETK